MLVNWRLGKPDSCARIACGIRLVLLVGLCLSLGRGTPSLAQEESEPSAQASADQPVQGTEAGGDSGPSVLQPEEPASPEPNPAVDGGAYPVSAIDLRYGGFAEGMEGLPDLESVREARFWLLETAGGFVAPRAEFPGASYSLDELFESGEVVLYGSAVIQIGRAIADGVIRGAGVVGVYAVPLLDQIAADGADLREGSTGLTIEVRIGSVSQVRSIASGDRVPFEDRMNSDMHARVRERSPVQPMLEGGQASFLNSRALDGYLHRLNRHPGRRVELAVAPDTGRDEAVVDYLIYENRPWRLYGQISNTGTKATNEWRERFGLTHTQLTGRDDILSLEYATAGFDQTHAVIASYNAPIGGSERLRGRVGASWSEFTASDVGDNLQNFDGSSVELDADLIYTFFQHKDLFIDVLAGVRYFENRINNISSSIEGEERFFVPRVGLTAERYRDTSTFDASLSLEAAMPGVTGVSGTNLVDLGRFDPDRSWQVLRGSAGYSFYLEPLLRDEYAPGNTVLAHEFAVSARGQWAFGNRLIPVEQQVAGGLYSVRGYPESIASGDSVVIGSAEYRFHMPRALTPGTPRKGVLGNEFRWRPTGLGDRPDWDLIARSFIDVARTVNSDRQIAFEFDETLVGAGLGLELVVRQNLSLRADWGIALKDMESGDVTAGSSRFHLTATFVY